MTSKLDRWAKSFVASCINKKRYRTAGFAEEVDKKVFRERGTKLYCYYCKECAGYHLTSRPPKDSKENRERIF